MTVLFLLAACERVDYDDSGRDPTMSSIISLPSVAQMLSSLPLEVDQLAEVHDAVSVSFQIIDPLVFFKDDPVTVHILFLFQSLQSFHFFFA